MRLIDADELLKKCIPNDLLTGEELIEVLRDEEITPTVDGWISVKDELPAICQPVLVVDSQKRVCIRHLVFISTENKLYWSQDKTDITHWMPLPEPPEEE